MDSNKWETMSLFVIKEEANDFAADGGVGDEDYWEGLLRSDGEEEEDSDESEQDTGHRGSIGEVIKVETVEVSKEHNPCSSTQIFYKCRCSKEVLLDERQFAKHLMKGECEEYRKYNSQFLK